MTTIKQFEQFIEDNNLNPEEVCLLDYPQFIPPYQGDTSVITSENIARAFNSNGEKEIEAIDLLEAVPNPEDFAFVKSEGLARVFNS